MADINKTFPKLYKKTNTGKIQTWSIRTETNVIITQFGQQDGKIQETKDVINAGKNTGKRNATTCIEQAQSEALSKWTKKKASGYVVDIKDAEENKVDNKAVLGGRDCMLAQNYDDHFKKIVYPASCQPKLDGGRGVICIQYIGQQQIIENVENQQQIEGNKQEENKEDENQQNEQVVGKLWKVTIWSRNRKPIKSMKHIVQALEQFFTDNHTTITQHVKYSIVLDGEFYNHALRDEFEELMSLLRQDESLDKCKFLEYHMYDIIEIDGDTKKLPFTERMQLMNTLFQSAINSKILPYLQLVPTNTVANTDELKQQVRNYLQQGYEGGMVRNSKSLYEQGKRSYHLQKIKEFQDAEFKIVGISEGRGKLNGHVASFICVNSEGTEFNVKCDGETSKLKEYFENHSLWKDKWLTVKFFSWTKNKLPRFPVGQRIFQHL